MSCVIVGMKVSHKMGLLGSTSCLDVWLDPDTPSALPDLPKFAQHRAREIILDLMDVPYFDHPFGHRFPSVRMTDRSSADKQRAPYKIPELGLLDQAASHLIVLRGGCGL